jgi:hypothetical protein
MNIHELQVLAVAVQGIRIETMSRKLEEKQARSGDTLHKWKENAGLDIPPHKILCTI